MCDYFDLDFRTKFLLTLVTSTICITSGLDTSKPWLFAVIYFLPFVLILSKGYISTAVKGILLYVIFRISSEILLNHYSGIFFGILMMINGVISKMLPGATMAVYIFRTTNMSDLVKSLKNMRMPDFVVIPISVMFRFFYSIKEDYSSINDAMKMYGLGIKDLVKNPSRFIEYKLVPLMMVSTKTADDVTISALTRGMIVGKERSSISDAKLRFVDYIFIAYSIAIACLHVF